MAEKFRTEEQQVLVVYTQRGGRREVRKVVSQVRYGGEPLHSREEVEAFLHKRRNGDNGSHEET